MPNEASKAVKRRLKDDNYAKKYFVGHGIDIGAGNDCLEKHKNKFRKILSCKNWDFKDGDAQYMASVPDNTFDFVHSSHCLEHMLDPFVAFKNWIRILKPQGHAIIIVPDEDLYEQGIFPSTWNSDHYFSFTIDKIISWCNKSINVVDLIKSVDLIKPIRIQLNEDNFNFEIERCNQTGGPAECSIEFIVRKL